MSDIPDISEPAPPIHGHLLHILGATFGVAVGVGTMIGSGILRSPSIIAATVPGVWAIMGLWLLGGVNAALGANVLAELGTALPRSGGPYVYAQRAFGDVGGLIVGWSTWVATLAGIAAASVSFAEFLPLILPWAAAHKIAIAVGVQVLIYGANMLGLREGRALQEATSFIKAAMLLVFVVAAIVLVAPPETQAQSVSVPLWSWAAAISAYQLIKGAYSGWDAPVYFTGENVNPAASIPRALGIGLLLTAILYIAVNAALLHALGPAGVAKTALPFTSVLNRFGGAVPAILFAVVAMITVASCANANIMSAPRILFALSQDGLLPHNLRYVNDGGSPTVAFALTALGSIALAVTGEFALVFGLIGTLSTLAALLVEASLFMLRRREPDLARPFRAIGYPLLPAIVIAVDAALLMLFALADRKGALFALILSLFCIPFAAVARWGSRRAA